MYVAVYIIGFEIVLPLLKKKHIYTIKYSIIHINMCASLLTVT